MDIFFLMHNGQNGFMNYDTDFFLSTALHIDTLVKILGEIQICMGINYRNRYLFAKQKMERGNKSVHFYSNVYILLRIWINIINLHPQLLNITIPWAPEWKMPISYFHIFCGPTLFLATMKSWFIGVNTLTPPPSSPP